MQPPPGAMRPIISSLCYGFNLLLALILVMALLSVSVCAKCSADPAAPGAPNFHRVNGNLYRGGQPTAQGWTSLERLGVKTVIDLRREGEHSTKAEQQAVEAAGMHYVNVPMKGIVAPTDEKFSRCWLCCNRAAADPCSCIAGGEWTGPVRLSRVTGSRTTAGESESARRG